MLHPQNYIFFTTSFGIGEIGFTKSPSNSKNAPTQLLIILSPKTSATMSVHLDTITIILFIPAAVAPTIAINVLLITPV